MPTTLKLPDGRLVRVPDDTSPEEMDAIVAAEMGEGERTWTDTIADALPMVGGAIGGMAGMVGGPVVATGTAALGGAAGQFGKRLVQGLQQRETPQGVEALVDAAKAGAWEGGSQAVGGVIGSGLARGARRLYQGLAKPATALRADFPDLIETALRERIPLTRGGEAKISRLVQQSSNQADNVVNAASSISAPMPAREALTQLRPVVTELRRRADIGQPNQLAAVGERGRRLLARHPQGIDLSRAQELKRTAQTAAQGAYKARNLGVQKELGANDLLDEAVARGLRGGIERRVPDVIPINAQTQSRIGVDRMVGDAVGREGNTLAVSGLRDLATIGGGAGLGSVVGEPATGAAIGLLVKLLSTPSTGSHAAILANDAARMGIPQQALRALMASSRERK